MVEFSISPWCVYIPNVATHIHDVTNGLVHHENIEYCGPVYQETSIEDGAVRVNAKTLAAFHTEAIGPDVVFLLQVFLLHVRVGPLERNAVVAGESFYPAVVLVGPLAQDFFGDGIDAVDVAEEWTMCSGRVSSGTYP